MDITANAGKFYIAMMRMGDWTYKWNKDGTLSLDAKKETHVHVTTYHGDFIEVVDAEGKVTSEGGDGDWFCVTIPAKKSIKLRFKELAKPSLTKKELDKARQIVTRCLVSDSPYSLGVPDKLIGAISWMQKKLNEIPAKYRDSAEIDFDQRSSYGESYDNIKITYREPETDKELILRLQVEAEQTRVKTNKERAAFLKLKQKFCAS